MPTVEEINWTLQDIAKRTKVLEDAQLEFTKDLGEIKDLLTSIKTSLVGDAPLGVSGIAARLVKVEADVAAIQRGNYVGVDVHNVLASRVDASTRVIEEVQKILNAHQSVITEYVNSKARREGASWMAGKIGKAVWAFIGAGGLVLFVKLSALLAPYIVNK